MMKRIINKYSTFIKYVFSAGISFGIDLGLFTLFNALLKEALGLKSIVVATVLARIISSFINYLLNRNKVFTTDSNKKMDKTSLIKYITLVITQMIISSISVTYLYKLSNINESIIKIGVDVVLFFVNFFVQKTFIFNNQKKNNGKVNRNLLLIVLSFITVISYTIYPDVIVSNIKHSLIIALIPLVYMAYKFGTNNIKNHKSFIFLSLIFSLLLIFGYSFDRVEMGYLVYNSEYLILSIIKLIGYTYSLNYVMSYIYTFCHEHEFRDLKQNRITLYFINHPFKSSVILLSIIYLIYFIAYYPGVVGYDPSYQIKEMMGIPNFYSESTTITTSSLLTQFNPVLHTILIGSLFRLGYTLGSVNLGICLYTLLQMFTVITILSYSIKFMRDVGVKSKLLMIILLFYALVPSYAYYSISAFKDTYYAIFIMLFIIQMYKFIKRDATKKDMIMLLLSAILVCTFRHNGYVTVLLSLVVLIFSNKKNAKKVVACALILSLIHFGYKKALEYFEVAPTSIREVLSVPLQQTARLVSEDEDIIEDEDKSVINKIIEYDEIKEKYNKELADPIKNTYKSSATNEDLVNYLNVWLKYLFKRPLVYIDATVNNVYGYFYPPKTNWFFYHYKYNILNDVGFDYHYNSLEGLRSALSAYAFFIQNTPVLGSVVNIGLYTWMYLYVICILVVSRKKKYIALLVPAILTILMCMVGPVNTYFRYVIPYAFSLPVIIGLLSKLKEDDK